MKLPDSFESHRVLILTAAHRGEEGICLGKVAGIDRWAVSPNSSSAILELRFENDFALLLDLSAQPESN